MVDRENEFRQVERQSELELKLKLDHDMVPFLCPCLCPAFEPCLSSEIFARPALPRLPKALEYGPCHPFQPLRHQTSSHVVQANPSQHKQG